MWAPTFASPPWSSLRSVWSASLTQAQVLPKRSHNLPIPICRVGVNDTFFCAVWLPSPQEEFQRLLSINLESAFALSQLAHPLLKASGDGIIIFNSSVAGGPTAMQSGSVYGLTKVFRQGQLASLGRDRCVHCLWAEPAEAFLDNALAGRVESDGAKLHVRVGSK